MDIYYAADEYVYLLYTVKFDTNLKKTTVKIS